MTREEIQALIDAAPDGRVGLHQAGRPVVSIPYGHHVLDGPIVIDRRVDVSFSGGVLLLPNGVRGMHLKTGAWGARVRDVCVFGQGQVAAQHGAEGILCESYGAEVADALVRFCGTGLRVASSAGLNCNGVQIHRVALHDCDTALHLKGGDTNGGTFCGLVVNVARVGILDESFLGNTFVGTMLHTVRERAYHCTVGANYSTFAGSYVEIDCGSDLPGGYRDTIDDRANVSWLGGGGAMLAKVGTRVGLNTARIRFGDRLPDGGMLHVTIPHSAVESALTAERKTALGALVDGFRVRWVSLLKQAGIEAYRPNVAGQSPTGDGLTRPIGWTSVGHADGFARSRVDAEHQSIGSPAGFKPEHKA